MGGGLPALGGVGTASALAKFYQAAIGAIESPLPVAGAAGSGDSAIVGRGPGVAAADGFHLRRPAGPAG